MTDVGSVSIQLCICVIPNAIQIRLAKSLNIILIIDHKAKAKLVVHWTEFLKRMNK